MEFLAESIGLLDVDSGASGNNKESGERNRVAEADASVAAAALSYLFPWGDYGAEEAGDSDAASENNRREGEGSDGDGDGDCFAAINEEDIVRSPRNSSTDGFMEDGANDGTFDVTCNHSEREEEDDELGRSGLSLLSSLTPASPLTLSASSLNLVSASIDARDCPSRRCCADCTDADADTETACRCNCTECPSKGKENNTAEALATLTTTHVTGATSLPDADDILTKYVTQRIDARTNYDCFTGRVDAVTGHLLHGIMLYRQTGAVYEGPFITKYVDTEMTNGNAGQYAPDGEEVTCDTASLRHGSSATCSYSNGMRFEGTFEFDHPKSGTWTGGGDGWTYEGPLAVFQEENGDKMNQISRYGSLTSLSSSERGSNGNLLGLDAGNQRSLKAIGISCLPDSVLFHGKGRFSRSDGSIYEGEFDHGLASGVGKEIMANGRGIYQGEFSNGLRHGVGTLMEDYVEESEDEWEECDCERSEIDDQDCADSTPSHGDRQSIDPGPDFAAGGTKSLDASAADPPLSASPDASDDETKNDAQSPCAPASTSCERSDPRMPEQCKKCNRLLRHRSVKTKKISSGVWCAGQYEIEDCRGTVNRDNKFTEEGRRGAAGIASGGASTGHHANNDEAKEESARGMRASLNRTTWDMLDEKWLGI